MSTSFNPVTSKRAVRGVRWEVNRRLVKRSVLIVGVLALALGLRYWQQSSGIGERFQQKAAAAAEKNDIEEQIRWLRQYRILNPLDAQGSIDYALACEAAVSVPPANRFDRVERSRGALRDALALGDSGDVKPAVTQDLRRRYIARLIQSGSVWADEIERQVIALNPPEDDPEMLRFMSIALLQLSRSEANQRSREPFKYRREQQAWLWLSQQPVGHVVERAWRANQKDLLIAGQLLELCLERPESFKFLKANSQGALSELDSAEIKSAPVTDVKKLRDEVVEFLGTLETNGKPSGSFINSRDRKLPNPPKNAWLGLHPKRSRVWTRTLKN